MKKKGTQINNFEKMIVQNSRDEALHFGEDIVFTLKIQKPPVNLFDIIKDEQIIHVEGADFGNEFDGRIQYLGKKYLLAYNDKYNKEFINTNTLHPRIRFTIAHELGHYFIDSHREMLKTGKQYSCKIGSFVSGNELERQADNFASGLLMPSYLLSPIVNNTPEPNLEDFKKVIGQFQVSMPSMMIRWSRLSDFPCGVFAISEKGIIDWGWTSKTIYNIGHYKKECAVESIDAKCFLSSVDFNLYSEGVGKGMLKDWVKNSETKASVEELYSVIPSMNKVLVFIYGYEDEFLVE